MLNERDNTKAKYDDLMRKHMDSRVAYGLEKDQKGERFTLIEPARLPENRCMCWWKNCLTLTAPPNMRAPT